MVELTGARAPARQREVLDQNRIPYVVKADDRPITTWEAVNQALSGVNRAPLESHRGINLQAAL